MRFRITLASAQVSSMFWEGTWNTVPCPPPPPAPLETVSSPCRLLLLLLEIVVHVSVISFKKTFFSFLSKKMFFVYFDRNECCCSAKIWSVVIKHKPVFVACVARIVRACEWIPSFFLLDCEMFKQAHIHTQDDGNKTKILLHSFTECCKHCCLYTFPIIYIHIYIYTHSVHCTIVIADCGPVTLIGKRGVVHFFSLRRQLRFCSVLFFPYVVGEKKCFCASGSKLSCCRNSFFRTYTHPMWVWKKKSTKFIVWFFFVL